jgi:hypothetical protein
MKFARLPLRRLIALLMLCALPLHAYALHCATQRTLAVAAMQADAESGHACHCPDDCAAAALCAAAHLLALEPANTADAAAPRQSSARPAPADRVAARTLAPPERPPRKT